MGAKVKGIDGSFEGKPIALYDADKKICIGVFDSPVTCGKYVFPEKNAAAAAGCVSQSLRGKHVKKASKNRLGVRLAFRLANEDQIKFLINDVAILLSEGYPEIPFTIGIKFDSNRVSMQRDFMRKRWLK